MKKAVVPKEHWCERLLTAGAMIVALGISMACAWGMTGKTLTPEPYTTTLADIRAVPSPEGLYSHPKWFGDWIIVQYATKQEEGLARIGIWRLRTDGSEFEKIELPNHPSCGPDGLNGFLEPAVLPDGRLSYAVDCSPAGDPFGARTHLMAYDPASGEVEQVFNYPLPANSVGTGGYAWNPEMTRMIMGDGHRYIDEQLYWFTQKTSEPIRRWAASGVWPVVVAGW